MVLDMTPFYSLTKNRKLINMQQSCFFNYAYVEVVKSQPSHAAKSAKSASQPTKQSAYKWRKTQKQ